MLMLCSTGLTPCKLSFEGRSSSPLLVVVYYGILQKQIC